MLFCEQFFITIYNNLKSKKIFTFVRQRAWYLRRSMAPRWSNIPRAPPPGQTATPADPLAAPSMPLNARAPPTIITRTTRTIPHTTLPSGTCTTIRRAALPRTGTSPASWLVRSRTSPASWLVRTGTSPASWLVRTGTSPASWPVRIGTSPASWLTKVRFEKSWHSSCWFIKFWTPQWWTCYQIFSQVITFNDYSTVNNWTRVSCFWTLTVKTKPESNTFIVFISKK